MLALRHRHIPRSLHAEEPNPKILFTEHNLKVATEPVDLPADGTLYAGVNSFGWGGTNAHVVLRTPPVHEPPAVTASGALLLPLTAHNDAALRRRAEDVLAALPEDADGVVRLAGSLGNERDHFPARAAVVASDAGELRERLGLFAADPGAEIPAWSRAGPYRAAGSPSSCPGRARSGPAWAGGCMPSRRCSRR